MSPPSPAQSYLAAAFSFYPGVDALSKGTPEVATACAFLAAQTLECALKSFLFHAGVPEADLKHGSRRHNLNLLWTEASSRGLQISVQPPVWCDILNTNHDRPYYLRYPIGITGFQVPAVAQMASELKRLLALVSAVV